MFSLKHIIALCILTFGLRSAAQVVNSGFESYNFIPTTTGSWNCAPGWTNTGSLLGSPDYYTYLAGSAADLPETPLAIVNAYRGSAVMGMIMTGRPGTNLREYLTGSLERPLEVGKTYDFRFRITAGKVTAVSTSGLSVKGIGVLFSEVPPVQNLQTPINLDPQFELATTAYSDSWQLIRFSFTATQPFMHFTIGVFGADDVHHIAEEEGTNPAYAYYFLDDFDIVENSGVVSNPGQGGGDSKDPGNPNTDDGEVVEEKPIAPIMVPNSFTPNGDGFNDLFLPVAGTVSHWELDIFDRWGKQVFHTDNENAGWDGTFQGKALDSGMYVYSVSYMVHDDASGWSKKVDQGSVLLLR
jgi:gliding motility-associated-like protein